MMTEEIDMLSPLAFGLVSPCVLQLVWVFQGNELGVAPLVLRALFL